MNTSPTYPSDLTDAQWACIEAAVPQQGPIGRPVKYSRRAVVNALLYITHTGCQWRYLPHEYPPWWVVRYYFDQWTTDGTLERLHTLLRERVRVAADRDAQPSAGLMDSQSVKTGRQPGGRGFDGGKKLTGRKRHLLTDTQGWLLAVLVTAASVSDPAGARLLLAQAHPHFPRLEHLWADHTYAGKLVAWVGQFCGWVLEIVTRPPPVHNFHLLQWRLILERPF